MNDFLLDTCTVIWMGTGKQIGEVASEQINTAYREGSKVCVSPISAWEIGALVKKGRIRLKRSAIDWFEVFTTQDGIAVPELSSRILFHSWELPGHPPNDPVDRIIISTARILNLTVITRDRLILNYSSRGYVDAVSC